MYKLLNIFILILYFCVLSVFYVFYLSTNFGYAGFSLEVDFIAAGYALCSLILFCLLLNESSIVGLYHCAILVLVATPSAVIFSFGAGSGEFYGVTLLCCAIVIVISRYQIFSVIRFGSFESDNILSLFMVIIFAYLFGIIAQGGFSYFNLNIYDVYLYRRASSGGLLSIYGYITPIVAKIIIPASLIMAIMMKKWVALVLTLIAVVLTFGLTAHKSILFSPLLILPLYFIRSERYTIVFSFTCLLIAVISILDYSISAGRESNGDFGSMFGRRLLMVPALLNSFYVDYFSNNSPYLWSQSKFSFGLIESPYGVSSVNLIGDVYMNKPDVAANVGWIGSGFANAGWVGAIFYSVLVGFLISYIDSVSRILGDRLVASVSSVIIISVITSTDIVTALLTHGLLALILVFAILPVEKHSE